MNFSILSLVCNHETSRRLIRLVRHVNVPSLGLDPAAAKRKRPTVAKILVQKLET